MKQGWIDDVKRILKEVRCLADSPGLNYLNDMVDDLLSVNESLWISSAYLNRA